MLSPLLSKMSDDPGKLFVLVLPYVLAVTAVFVLLHLIASVVLKPASPRYTARWRWWEKLVYLGTVGSVGLLAVTAFYSVLAFGHMLGWMLFAHLIGAGTFVVVLLLVALMWSHASRFGQNDDDPAATDDVSEAESLPRFGWVAKVSFWVMLTSGVATAASMLVSMLPLLGTADMQGMINLHRYAGLVLVVAMVFHIYGVWLGRMGLR